MNFKISSRRAGLAAFAILAAVGLLEVFLRLGGEVFYLEQEKVNRVALARRGSYVILCLGESMTAGGGLSSYPRQLEDTLNALGLAIPVAVVNLGIPSANSGMIVARLEEDLDAYRPDMVVLMMGINDEMAPLDLAAGAKTERPNPFLERSRAHEFIRDTWRNLLSGRGMAGIGGEGREEHAAEIAVAGGDSERARRVNFYLKRGDWHFDEDSDLAVNRRRAIEMYEKALALNPEIPTAILKTGISHRELGERSFALASFEKACAYPSVRCRALAELGNLYRDERNWDEAKRCYGEASRFCPDSAVPFLEWSRLYQIRGEWERAAGKLVEALGAEPFNRLPYQEAEKLLEIDEAREGAETALRAALASAPFSLSLNMLLADLYERQERQEAAEELYRFIIGHNSEAFWAYTALGNLYRRWGKEDLARNLYREADERRFHHTATKINYRRLKEIVLGRGIQLVCAQYPLAPVSELIGMVGEHDGITFVDNERVFREAVQARSYEYYFFHIFPGQIFGHCTPRGNRLLAENIARALIAGPLRRLAGPVSLEKMAALAAEDFPLLRNLLSDPLVAVSTVSIDSAGRTADRLIELEEESGRRVFWERFGSAARVRVDFGNGRDRVVRAVASHHPRDPDHLAMSEHYFQGAEIYGSSDGVTWHLVASADHYEYPGEGGWRIWSFANAVPFRHYELRLPAGAPSGDFRQSNEIALFE